MAVASFIDKIAQSASTLLADFDASSFIAKLSGQRVVLAFDESAVVTAEGRATAALVADLLARLYPRLDVVPLGSGEGALALATELYSSARAINPKIEGGVGEPVEFDAAVCVGTTPFRAGKRVIYAGSDGWIAKVSTDHPVGSAHTTNPFGACAAACLAAANVFRAVFDTELGDPGLDGDATLSLLDYAVTGRSPANVALPEHIDVGELFLVGVGAIGHGAIWAWACVEGLHGVLHLVDEEEYDESNLQRYVGTVAAGMRPAKSENAVALLSRRSEVRVEGHAQTWDEYLHHRGDWNLDRVALALDSAEDRILAQASLPRRIYNSWTQSDSLGISRHDFLSTACVACLYLPGGAVPDLDDLVVNALRFDPREIMAVRYYLDTGHPLDRPLIEKIAGQVGVAVEVLLPFEGEPLIALYQRAACGGLILRFGGELGDSVQRVEVPMAFQSALAGIMLAAEVVIDAAGLRPAGLPVRTDIDLLRLLSGTLNSPEAKDSTGRCICRDDDFIEAYRTKYDAAPPE